MPNKKHRQRTDILLTEHYKSRKKKLDDLIESLKEEVRKMKLKKKVA